MQRRDKSSYFLPASIAALALALPTSVQAQKDVLHETPLPDGCAPGGAACPGSIQAAHVAPEPLLPSRMGPGVLVYPNTRVVANGTSLRDVAGSAISLVGMPPGSTVVAAYLYWSWISLNTPGVGLHDRMSIARVPRMASAALSGPSLGAVLRPVSYVGVQVGAGADPCWNGGANYAFRANVTAAIQQGDTFMIWLPPGAAGQQNYRDPWAFPFPTGPHCEGATLVVVYTNTTEFMGTTYIYDVGLAGNMFLASPGTGWTLTGFFYPGAQARWINIAADGQSGAGYEDLSWMGLETTYFNGFAIAGQGSPTDSDWNGSSNKPLALMWDTTGHDVTWLMNFGDVSANIGVAAPAGTYNDCLVPICNVLWMR